MFADTAKIHLKAGRGGDGAVSFRREIYIPKGGPDGGNGGKGGDIIFVADKDTDTLVDFRFNPLLAAENGKNGAGSRSAGRSGENLILKVPVGTLIYKIPSETSQRVLLADLTKDSDCAVIAHGGAGGFGNAHFKSSVRQTPTIAEVGEPGEEFDAELELRLVADVGLVGLPNAGKSTFLSVVTNATPKIADYPFTTLTPSLGIAEVGDKSLLIADIPGLIEGAAAGKGLGHDFLRHVSRTSVLLHLIDVYSDDAGVAYSTIRHELENYQIENSPEDQALAKENSPISPLSKKPEIVALTKCESVDDDIINLQKTQILAQNPQAQIFTISSSAHRGLKELLFALQKVVETEKNKKTAEASMVSVGNSLVPTISLSEKELSSAWTVEKNPDSTKFLVHGAKIEKFARRTDFSNYASVNRLRDIMKKLGIRAELTNQGATPDSIISIAGHEFTLTEQD